MLVLTKLTPSETTDAILKYVSTILPDEAHQKSRTHSRLSKDFL